MTVLLVTYLQEFINLNLSVLVEVHLVKDFMERIFINVDIDALQRRKTRAGINKIWWRQVWGDERQTEKERKTTYFQNLLDVDGGDESFALFVKLMEALLVPATQIFISSVRSLHLILQHLGKPRKKSSYSSKWFDHYRWWISFCSRVYIKLLLSLCV